MKIFALLFAIFAVVASAVAIKDPICGLKNSVDGNGLIACAAFMPSFSYVAATNECVQFTYGGCGGNKNRFSTEKECKEMCVE